MSIDVMGTLHRLGWPQAVPLTVAVRAFQASTPALAVDGIVGPKTTSALSLALSRLAAGASTLSAHFSYREFACHCGGTYAADGCDGILAHPVLVRGLEDLRVGVIRGPLVLASGYRCRRHNADVGGAVQSQHLYGAAADITPTQRLSVVRERKTFSGIGVTAGGMVRHVDVRHVSGHNPTGSTTAAPAVWTYAA